MKDKVQLADYPLAENAPESIRSGRGKTLDELTMEGVISGSVTIEDLRITPEALKAQAAIARSAGRPALGDNFARGAELVSVPQELIIDTYELLRPGRAKRRKSLLDRAELFRRDHGAEQIARFIETAAEQYFRRGLIAD